VQKKSFFQILIGLSSVHFKNELMKDQSEFEKMIVSAPARLGFFRESYPYKTKVEHPIFPEKQRKKPKTS